MITPSSLSEDILTASVVYRRGEEHALRTQPVVGTVKLRMAQDPTLADHVQKAWTDLQDAVHAHFVQMIPTAKRDRAQGRGPATFEVHHTLCVAKECYLLALYTQHHEAAALDASAAAEFTLRRIGITANPADFFQTTPPFFAQG